MSVRKLLRKILIYPRKAFVIRNYSRFRRLFSDMKAYNKANTRPEFHAEFKHLYPCINDWDAQAGSASYYFWQDLWAAKKIFHNKPSEHFDIGSRLDGFIAHVLTFMPVTMLDIRPLDENIEGLKFIQADATNLEGIPDNSLISLSSLCAPEHFGLGRYNDPVDPEACFKAFKSMQRVLSHGGHLYISVPIGEHSGVAFNAHRIFKPELIINALNELKLADFSMVNEKYIEHADYKTLKGINYRGGVVGFFEFVKE
ncbi:MAG: DUF268 domain-containing protein [Synergistaceae bacterium]|nr:DUF268 domain-containing protein [Synergistaceae bacterium]